MSIPKFLKNKPFIIPVLGVFLVVSFFIFSIIFNFGIENFKVYRGLASTEKKSPEINKVILNNVSKVLDGRHTEFSVSPNSEEKFILGLLKGNYKAFKVDDHLLSIKLKSGSKAQVFKTLSAKNNLAKKFKDTYLSKDSRFSKPDRSRFIASHQLSYSIVEDDVISGRVEFKFDEKQKLQEILVKKI